MQLNKRKRVLLYTIWTIAAIWVVSTVITGKLSSEYYTLKEAPGWYQYGFMYSFMIGGIVLILLTWLYISLSSRGMPPGTSSQSNLVGGSPDLSVSFESNVWWPNKWYYGTRLGAWFTPQGTLSLNNGILALNVKLQIIFQEPATNIVARQDILGGNGLDLDLPDGKKYSLMLTSPRLGIFDDPNYSRIKDWKIALNSAGAKIV